MRFTSHKDQERGWAEKEKIKKCKELSSYFFVADFPGKWLKSGSSLEELQREPEISTTSKLK